jgi:hypothetical protein
MGPELLAIELHKNAKAIEAWRATLPERQRRRLIHPLSNVRRWRAATTHNGKCPTDLKRDAVAAWRRFVACVSALPFDQAAPLRQAALGEIATMMLKQVSKQAADYSLGRRDAHCGKALEDDESYCRYLIEPRSGLATELGRCEKVEGPISRVFWCRLFARAQSR